MLGSKNFSTYERVSGPEVLLQTSPPAVVKQKVVPGQKEDSSGRTSPGLTYLAAGSQGYNKRVSRLIEGADKFVEGIQNDNPDYKYVRRVLRSQGLTRKADNNRNKIINPHNYYLKGGKLKDSQKEFVAYLIQISGSLTEQELTDFIQSLGEDGLKQEYQNFLNIMEQGTTSAKNGAKLNYIKSLRGKCPEGYELGYFKEGGHICAKCVEKKEKQGAIPFKPIQGEKGTKVVQDFKKDLKGKKDKITLPKKQTEKKELGGIINIKPEFLEAFKCGGKMKKENGGLVKKDKKILIKEQFINKDKCGGKAKKKKK